MMCRRAHFKGHVDLSVLRSRRSDGNDDFALLEAIGRATTRADPYPRPTNGIAVAITVMVSTLASSGRLAM